MWTAGTRDKMPFGIPVIWRQRHCYLSIKMQQKKSRLFEYLEGFPAKRDLFLTYHNFTDNYMNKISSSTEVHIKDILKLSVITLFSKNMYFFPLFSTLSHRKDSSVHAGKRKYCSVKYINLNNSVYSISFN